MEMMSSIQNCSLFETIIKVIVFYFSSLVLGSELELVTLLGDSVVADDSRGRLLLEVVGLCAGPSAGLANHDLLFIVHVFDQFRSLRLAFGVDLLVQLTCVKVLVEFSPFSLKISDYGVSGSRLVLEEGVVISDGDGRHLVFCLF